MLNFIKSYISESLALDSLIDSVKMPVSSSNLTSTGDINYNPIVTICDILAGSHTHRKRKNDVKEEETPRIQKKRIVKIVSDEDEKKGDSDYENNDSDYEVKKVNPKKRERISEHQRKKVKIAKKDTLSKPKPKGMNSYEQMIEKKRAERIAFLKSMEIDQIKEEISEAVGGIKQLKKSARSWKKPQYSPPNKPIRRSKRLANLDVDFSEDALEKLAVKNAFQASQIDNEDIIPTQLTFEAALKSVNYEECISDLSIQESKSNQEFISYDKHVLKSMTLNDFNVCKVVPARITSATWYPSKENLIVAAGDKFGHLGLWKIQDSETSPHLFKVHGGNIPNMQFSLFDPTQLITVSYDGTMRCGDLIKHSFEEIYVTDKHRVTWFDFLSSSTFLISHSNGEVALFDKKTKGKTSQKRHACQGNTIKTVSVHPVNKNIFVTADNKSSIRLWDLRKLQEKPIVEILHHKRSVNSAYFSPVTGKSLLTTSQDDSICIFDTTQLTQDVKLTTMMHHNNFTGRWLSIFRATWLPNSDDLFAVGCMEQQRIEVYDKDLNLYHNIKSDNLTTLTSIHRFHPYRSALAAANSSGKLFVFT